MAEASIRFYRSANSILTTNTAQMAKAIEQAAADGVDVLNNSWQFHTGMDECNDNCDNSFSPSNIRAQIEAAENLGVVVVAAAGNVRDNFPSCGLTCDVVFPAVVPDVISVSGLADTTGTNYRAVDLAGFASRGSKNVTRVDGTNGVQPFVQLAPFGTVKLAFDIGTNTYDTIEAGTSFAAPQVASLAGANRQMLFDIGTGVSGSAWAVAVQTLLMGDGSLCAGCSGTYASLGISGGYGFPKFFNPASATDVGAGGGWGMANHNIVQGQTISWRVGGPGNEPAGITGWKLVVAVDASSASNFPNLWVRVVDVNTGVVIGQSQTSGVLKHGILLPNASYIVGKDLEVRITGNGVKAGGESIWVVDYFFTNSAANHIDP